MFSRPNSIALILIIVFLSTYSYGQRSNNTISGHIFGSNRAPVGNVYVELLDEMNGVIARTKTNTSGMYLFGGLSSGNFTVKVLAFGTDYDNEEVEVSISTSGIAGRAPSESIQQDVYLKIRKASVDTASDPGVIFAQEVPTDAQEAYKRAQNHFSSGETQAAIDDLTEAIKIFPDYFLALQKLAQEFGGKEDWVRSAEYYERAVKVNTRSFACMYGLASAAFRSGNLDKASEAAKQAVITKPESSEAHLLRGMIERKKANFADAEKAFLSCLKLSKGKSAEAHWNIALLYVYNIINYAAAADHLQQYLDVSPKVENAETIKKLIKDFRAKASSSKS